MPETVEEITNRFTYHPPTPDQIPRYEQIRDEARQFALSLMGLCPPGELRSTALVQLQLAVMAANASIACDDSVTSPT